MRDAPLRDLAASPRLRLPRKLGAVRKSAVVVASTIVAVVLSLSAAAPIDQDSTPTTRVRGSTVVVGGGDVGPEIYDAFVRLAGGVDAKILVVPISTGLDDPGSGAVAAFRARGATNVAVWNPKDATAADEPASLAALDGARGFYFGGGDQNRGMTKIAGTKALSILRAAHESGAVVGGTSAGAALLSAVMMRGGDPRGPIASGRAELADGAGFVRDYVVDQHFLARGRLPRLVNVLLDRPTLFGLGVDEGTAAVFSGDALSVVGVGQVVVVSKPIGVRSIDVAGRALAAVDELRLRVLLPGDAVDAKNPFSDVARKSTAPR